ncbi:MAG: hypothetical protein IPH76_19035 [Xanthomonadales bacterium]|nr:hypothetical protein [Xanthomonadales bacterium]
MNHAAILDALTGATSFDLFRLRAAIDRALRDPARSTAVRRCLQPGQPVEYFDARDNRSRDGCVVELRPAAVVVLDHESGTRFLIEYAAINLDGVDSVLRDRTDRGLGRRKSPSATASASRIASATSATAASPASTARPSRSTSTAHRGASATLCCTA